MPTYFGNGGSATITPSGLEFAITEWQAAVEIDVAVAPGAFGEDWEEAEHGIGRITGTLTGKLGSSTVLALPAEGSHWTNFKGALTLTAATGKTLAGNALFSNISVGLAANGAGTITANFRSTGAWTGIAGGA